MFRNPVQGNGKGPFSVYHYHFDKANKPKFLILVSENPSAYVIVNTSTPRFHIGKPEEKLNILLPLSEHDFFNRDSKANCSEIHVVEFNHRKTQKHERGFVGYVHENCREEILTALNRSVRINNFLKNKINKFCTPPKSTPTGP